MTAKTAQSVTRDDLSNHLVETGGAATKKEAEVIVTGLLDYMSANLTAGVEIRLHGFGNFKVVTRAARAERDGRNPQTGESLRIAAQPEKNAVTFKPATALTNAVQ